MPSQKKVLLFDISGDKTLGTAVEKFFADKDLFLKVVNDIALFQLLASKKREYVLAVALVNKQNAKNLRSNYRVPTTVFRPDTFESAKLERLYSELFAGS